MKYNKLLPSLLSLLLTSCCGSPIGLSKLFLYKITNIDSNNNVSMDLYIGLKQKGDGTLSFSKLKNPKLTIYINYIKPEMRPSDITTDETKIKEESIILFERDNFEDNDYFFEQMKNIQKEIEMPNPAEGFSKIFMYFTKKILIFLWNLP